MKNKKIVIFLIPFLTCCKSTNEAVSPVKYETNRQKCASIVQDILDKTYNGRTTDPMTGEPVTCFNYNLLFRSSFKYKYWAHNINQPYYCNPATFAQYFEYDSNFDYYHLINFSTLTNLYYFKLNNVFYNIGVSKDNHFHIKNDKQMYDHATDHQIFTSNPRKDEPNHSLLLKNYIQLITEYSCSYKYEKDGTIELHLKRDVGDYKVTYDAYYNDYLCTSGTITEYDYSTITTEYKMTDSIVDAQFLHELVSLDEDKLSILLPTEEMGEEFIRFPKE